MGEIVLLRHGETEWSHDGRHTSVTDIELTAGGRSEAASVAPLLRHWRFVAVWSSPRKRALDTAHLAGLNTDDIRVDLAEWAYGDAEGKTRGQVSETEPSWNLWTSGGIGPGGETPDQVAARADRLIFDAEPLLAEGDVAFVSHSHFLRVLAARWLGGEPQFGAHLQLGTGSVSALGYEHGIHAITLWDLTPRLLGVAPARPEDEKRAEEDENGEPHNADAPDWGGDSSFAGEV
ncbi:histidine phosphatase family protein [Salininema proteolyticum]|uniref:Histidine phosphatase family protein n=1 Tax=Salininema proteolyticum TaxID=1607685 RepID=A0ABV8TSJ9_9ACTN